MQRAFTLIELLVVIAIISLLAAILFPVFSRAKSSAKKTTCLSNIQEIDTALVIYALNFDDRYPQTKRSSNQPAIDDAGGGYEEPDYGTVFELLYPFIGSGTHTAGTSLSAARIYACPVDLDPFGDLCTQSNPDAPDVTSYLANGYFVFGLSESSVTRPASTIYLTERRSAGTDLAPPYCDYIYRPWWNPSDSQAPEDDMNAITGAVATTRHFNQSNFAFVDGHAKSMPWAATYAPPTVDLHLIDQQ